MAGYFFRRLAAGLVIAALGAAVLAGCGRDGMPELPPSAMMENEKGDMVPKPRQDRPFILDRLIR